jgi:transcriptional/translational regulatory protein YebC/TACO1
VRDALAKAGYTVNSAEVSMAPMSTVEVDNWDTAKLLLRLLDTLESHDDVEHVFANFDMDAKYMQEFLN